jgi:hypothetical protein
MPLYAATSTRYGNYGGAPEDHGFLSWTFDPALAASSSLLVTAGTAQGGRIYVVRPVTVTNLVCQVVTGGSGLTSGQNKAAIYNSSGTLLGTSADQSTPWASSGTKTMALVTPVAVVPGYYDVALWFNGTTAPTVSRQSTNLGVNANLATTSLRFFTAGTAATTAAPSPIGTKSAQSISWWLALS